MSFFLFYKKSQASPNTCIAKPFLIVNLNITFVEMVQCFLITLFQENPLILGLLQHLSQCKNPADFFSGSRCVCNRQLFALVAIRVLIKDIHNLCYITYDLINLSLLFHVFQYQVSTSNGCTKTFQYFLVFNTQYRLNNRK